MEREHTCCVTGHRTIPDKEVPLVQRLLKAAVIDAITQGYTHFISGFAQGVDLMFAEIVVELKASFPITLEAAIPCPSRMKTPDETFQRLIGCCDVVKILSDHYFRGCYMRRNRYMVDQSSLVISVWDGREAGGTAETVRYALRKSMTVSIFEL